jgi:mono/diheme cytochrome c family protein
VKVLVAGLGLVMAAFCLAGCKSLPPPMPLEQLNAQQARGHEVFQAQCARCHYDRRSGGLHGPSLLGIYKESSLPSGAAATDERVTATIILGRGMMPAMKDKLSEQDLNDLLAYLHTL